MTHGRAVPAGGGLAARGEAALTCRRDVGIGRRVVPAGIVFRVVIVAGIRSDGVVRTTPIDSDAAAGLVCLPARFPRILAPVPSGTLADARAVPVAAETAFAPRRVAAAPRRRRPAH